MKEILVPLLMLTPLVTEEPLTIKIAAINWCPQICVNEKMEGYTVDLVKKIFEGSNYFLQIDILPWSRAIKYVSSGRYDALLAPAKKEAPNLTFPKHSIGSQKMCFFTKADLSWNYEGEKSLKNMSIGIASDTSIEELNEYISKNPTQFQYQPYHERYIVQNAHKLLKGRIDSFLFTKNTTQFELAKANLSQDIRNAGCVSEAAIYLAFSSQIEKQEKVNKAIAYFDQHMNDFIKSGEVDKIMLNYGIEKTFTKKP